MIGEAGLGFGGLGFGVKFCSSRVGRAKVPHREPHAQSIVVAFWACWAVKACW